MPRIILDINDDDEFRSCQVCHSRLTVYDNTATATAASATGCRPRTFAHSNCVKCGLFIEMNPKQRVPSDCALIFVCSSSQSHRHCLCWECGLLYDLCAADETGRASEAQAKAEAEQEAEAEVALAVAAAVGSDSLSDHNVSTSSSQSPQCGSGKPAKWSKIDEEQLQTAEVAVAAAAAAAATSVVAVAE